MYTALRRRTSSRSSEEKLDLYHVLGLERDCGRDEILREYKQLALRYHPSKSNDREATTMFKNIAVAYEVLSDPDRRSVYDKTGKFDSGSDPNHVFTSIFGPNYDVDVLNEDINEILRDQIGEPDPPVSTDFSCTLEQLYTGVTKVFDITKNIHKIDGSIDHEKKRINIKVKPGWKSGTKITFPKEGDIYPNKPPADLVFVLYELPHAYYVREGDNLIYNAKITLKQALKGVRLHLPFLDGSTKTVQIQKVISPGLEYPVKNYGMPKKDGSYGDLIIKFDILFPQKLNDKQKDLLNQAFDDSQFQVEWK